MFSHRPAARLGTVRFQRVPASLPGRLSSTAAVCAVLSCAACGGGSGAALSNVAGISAAAVIPATPAPANAHVAASGYDAVVLTDGAVGFYRLGDTTRTLTDATGNALNGSYGSAVVLGATGLTSANSAAAAFPGGDYDASLIGSVAPAAQLQPKYVSVETWVDAASYNTSNRYQPIVSYGRYHSGTSYQLTITPINQFYFSIHTAAASPSIVAKTPSAPGRIFHLVGTYDGANLKLYVNGVLEGQGAASGAIDYSGLYSWTGLAIGSGYDALPNHPLENYAGTIGDVSIYNFALTPAQVMNHYLSGVKAPPITETPAAADAFVDSIGVDAPFNYQYTAYDTQYSSVKALLIASGIRHIRSGLIQSNWPTYYSRLNELAASGIHSELVTVATETAAQLLSYAVRAQPSIEAIEGPNEPDDGADPNWLAPTRSFMQVLHQTIKGSAATANVPIVGPSVIKPADQAAIGDLSAYLDYGNVHAYYGTNNPGNTGTGSITGLGRSGSVPYFVNAAGQMSGTKPLVVSETGYGTNPAIAGNVSELCDGKQTPRTYFEHFKAGIARTLPYQFVESGTAYGALGSFSYMGFLRQDLSPKPSYNAVKSLTGLLSDPGGAVARAALTYTIGGNVSNLDHLLMQKRNGTYYLALWVEVPSWNAVTNTDITAPPQTVTIALPSAAQTAGLASLDDNGNLTTATLPVTGQSVTFPVTDRVSVLSFHR
jgi:hypothetical protein